MAIVALSGLNGGVIAGYKAGMKALDRENYKRAFKELRPVAEKGHAQAQLELGKLYRDGNGVTRNDEKAAEWMSMAANNRIPEANFALGMMYREGRGVPRDSTKARALLERSVEGNYNAGKLPLAQLYFESGEVGVRTVSFAVSTGIVDDESLDAVNKALDSFTYKEFQELESELKLYLEDGRYSAGAVLARLLAHRGSKTAQRHLGTMLAHSFGASQNLVEAYKWLRLSKEEGKPATATTLLLRVKSAFSPAEIEALETQIERWRPASWTGDDEEDEILVVGIDGVTVPRRITHRKPGYPDRAAWGNVTGEVTLQAVITKQGKVADLVVLRCTRPGMGFEEFALSAVHQWLYEPSTKDEKAVEVYFTILVHFVLK